jgi:iron complex transport system permease protein
MSGRVVIPVLLLLTITLFVCSLMIGTYVISLHDIKESILRFDKANDVHYVLMHLRLPRVILAFLVGAALAFSGYLIQIMVNNPLAEPYLMGTASGASLGANLVYTGIVPFTFAGFQMTPVFAFAGAAGVSLLVISLSYEKGHINPAKLLLGGVALSSFLVAVISLLIFFSDTESKLKAVIVWSMGSFERAGWDFIPLLTITLIASNCIFVFFQKHLNILLLGESRSYTLGVKVSQLRWFILIFISLNTGFAVATSGPIGFVGLFIPHFVRALFGITGRFNLLYSSWIGGLFILGCDYASRIAYPPAGLPIGIITSFLGIPFFVYLLHKRNYSFS